ncbi:non-ribosomal peptide synthetase [Lewinella sp. IMCC34191]|uniref:non-ribosomal peptide synthetase n=1 Tax=Lewinella sp. IMCC34191 TaxID=2259172 RepID=UPI000E27C8A7|nr:non-ribosomal peptide synthetase [Lewinella sp. IMCC34191]
MSNSLLNRWRNRKKPTPSAPEVPAASGDYPASTGQQRLWVLDRLSPGNPFYNYAESFGIAGQLDPEALRLAFSRVGERHDILRTTFHETGEGVRQRVGSGPGFTWTYSARPLSQEEIVAAAKRPFDLQTGPLTRLLLVREAPNRHRLVVSQHHIITDKQSMRILCEEAATAYRALRQNQAVNWTPLPLQYGEFAHRQVAQDAESGLDFWKTRLAGAPPLLALPTDFPRPPQQTYRGRYAEATLSVALSTAVREYCRQHAITPYVYLLSAYYVLLYRYSGQHDLLVGTPVSNRDTTDLERLIGFFNETLVLRQHLRCDMPFDKLVDAVRQTLLEAFAHKHVGFDAVVKALNPARQAGANPLFQAMFILHNIPKAIELEDGVALQSKLLDLGVTKFDLTMYVADYGERFDYTLEYATDLFTPGRMERMLYHYARILRQVTQQPNVAIGDLELVTAEELPPPSPEPDTELRTVDRQIVEAARQNPDRVAVSCGEEQLTYHQLDSQSMVLAHRLVTAGAGPGMIVGLHVERGVQAIVGLLAILRTGAAYLPLDPTYPRERRRFMIEDSGTRFVLTDGNTDLPADPAVRILPISPPTAESVSATKLAECRPSDPVYLIYTSGSSGRPKGIQVTHRNLSHSNAARREVYGAAPSAFLLLSSFSFDSSVVGIFWTLCGGGKLVISETRAEQDPAGLGELIRREGVSHTLMLPTLYRQLLEFADADSLHSLSTVIVAGEACTCATIAQHFDRLPNARLYNEYGPTEATVWATVHRVLPGDQEGPVPIGEAVPGYDLLLTDGGGKLVPTGVPGEICIGGRGLTQGYLNRAELTAEKFTQLSLPDGRSPRVYRTGDLGIRREDGALLFLGRRDRQVKVRGYRVELGEVSKQLVDDPAVTAAEVVVAPSGNQLVAYVVSTDGKSVGDLTTRLRDRMPDYMVPGQIIVVEDFPRLPNGKVDLRALVAMTGEAAKQPGREARPPSNATEEKLLSIWREVLGQEDIGVTDNFFALGGDSILSIRILARARRAGIELPATAIFDRQTIRELAAIARDTTGASADVQTDYHGPVPLTPIQSWFFQEHEMAPHFWNQAWWLEMGDNLDQDRLRTATETLYRRQEALRQQFFVDGAGNWQARILPPDHTVPFSVRRTEAAGQEPDWLDFQHGIDLNRDPLFRVVVCASPAGRRLLVWAHHLVVDMVSWEKVFSALRGESASGGTPYHRWAQQLRQWGRDDKFSADLPFWKRQTCSTIRTDLPGRLPVPQASVRTLPFEADQATTSGLLQEANEAYGTRAEELLLTAVLRTVRSHFDGPDLCLNVERHGREALDSEADIGETVGWFTASYPLTFHLPGTDPGPDIISTKETLRAVPDQGIGYGVLRYLGGHDELDQQPRLYFNYLGQSAAEAGTHGPRFIAEGIRSPEGEFNRTWELNASVRDGRLEVRWSFSDRLHHAATIQSLGEALLAELQTIVAHCREREDQQFTPSDFPEASLSQDDLDGLLDQIGG